MGILKISNKEINLNEIENFLEDICDRYNFRNSFHGNVIIAITELVSIVTNLGGEGKLVFENLENELLFRYKIDSISADINSIFSKEQNTYKIESDYEKSIFLIMGLCDDFKIDEESTSISISFKKEGVEKEITSHRKEYLKNYLGKTIESLS